ncbi:MAG: hypothetical protein P8Y14_30610, partial [Anaerolineales bacterium]
MRLLQPVSNSSGNALTDVGELLQSGLAVGGVDGGEAFGPLVDGPGGLAVGPDATIAGRLELEIVGTEEEALG